MKGGETGAGETEQSHWCREMEGGRGGGAVWREHRVGWERKVGGQAPTEPREALKMK